MSPKKKNMPKFRFGNHFFGMILCLFLVSICKASLASPYFGGTGLTDIPTAYTMNHGVFDAGVHVAIRDEKRQELSLKMEFGLLNFAEIGIVGLKMDDRDYIKGKAKVTLAKEEGILPAFAVGIDNFGENVDGSPREHDMSFYAVISKQFNLPFLHLISGHLGIGNKSYVCDESIGKYLHGGFVALNKDWIIDSRDMRISLMTEIKGKWANIGLRCLMNSGLGINLAVGQFDFDRKDISYNIGLSFTNEPIMKNIAQSMELAKQAVRIANEARSGSASE